MLTAQLRLSAVSLALGFSALSSTAATLYFGGAPISPRFEYFAGAIGRQDEVYEDFDLSAATHITGIFYEGYRAAAFDPNLGRFEIRRNLSEGSGGELVASGSDLALTLEPRAGGAIAGVDFNRYHIDGLDVTLQPGKYWVMMHVNAYVELSETDGTGGIGGPLGNGNAFLTSPWHSNAFLQAIPPTGNFAYGIEGSAVPEPASMSLYVAGLTLMGIKRRRRITRL